MEHISSGVRATNSSKEIVVMLDLRFKPGSTDIVIRKLMPAIYRTRAEPGNIEFRFYKAQGSDDRFVIFERWKNEEALEWHWKQPYTREMLELFNEHLVNLLSERENVHYFNNVVVSKQAGSK